MSYDRMGRRVVKNAERFVYDGYLCGKKLGDLGAKFGRHRRAFF